MRHLLAFGDISQTFFRSLANVRGVNSTVYVAIRSADDFYLFTNRQPEANDKADFSNDALLVMAPAYESNSFNSSNSFTHSHSYIFFLFTWNDYCQLMSGS